MIFKKLFFITSLKNKQKIILFFWISIIYSIIETFSLYLIFPYLYIIQSHAGSLENKGFFFTFFQYFNIMNEDNLYLYLSSIFLFFVLIIKTLLQIYVTYLNSYIPYNIFEDLSARLNKVYMSLNWSDFINLNSNHMIKNVTRTCEVIGHGYVVILSALSNFVLCLFIMSLLIYQNFLGTVIIFLFMSFFGILLYLPLRKRQTSAGIIREEEQAKLNQKASEIYLCNREISILEKSDYFQNDFKESLSKLSYVLGTQNFLPKFPSFLIENVVLILVILLVVYSLHLGIDVSTLVPYLIFYALAGRRLLPSFLTFLGSVISFKAMQSAINIIFDEYNLPQEKVSYLDSIKIDSCDSFSISNIYFDYNNKNILSNISMEFYKNEYIAIVGKSGSGKSTLLDIITGLIKPKSGNLYVNSTLVKSLSFLRKRIGFVPQTVNILDDTIASNIAFGVAKDQIDYKKLKTAINQSELEKVINTLPDGFNTKIGERGIKFSGGQKQRIGIARAIYNNPEILILDEATSSLDSETEKNVMKTINKISKEKIVITVAHQLSTIKKYNRIYVLNQGSLVSKGNHDELIKNCSYYQDLYKIS